MIALAHNAHFLPIRRRYSQRCTENESIDRKTIRKFSKPIQLLKSMTITAVIKLIFTSFMQLVGEKNRSQSSTFWHIWEKHGFHSLTQKIKKLVLLIEAYNEIDKVSKFHSSLSFDAKQNAPRQIIFALWIFKDLFAKNSNWFFF